MTPEWIKPLALEDIRDTISNFDQGISFLCSRNMYSTVSRAAVHLRAAEDVERLQQFEWAIGQQRPPHLWLGPEHAVCAGGINFAGQLP